LLTTRERLRALYKTQLPKIEMRDRKQQEFGLLKYRYQVLKTQQWNGYTGYDRWFDQTLNNAHLISAATYYGCIPGFKALLDSVGGDLPRFYEEVRKVAATKAARVELCSKQDPSQPGKGSTVPQTHESGGS
jgi:predicted aminopeptidase